MIGALGRHVQHDPRSWDFRIAAPATDAVITPRTWHRYCPVYNQGGLGSCTGNAMTGVLMTEGFWVPGRELTEDHAISLYSAATSVDEIPGQYPPDDTGSSGLGVAKAAQMAGYIAGYEHAFGLNDVLHSLNRGPGMLGLPWYSGFDHPDSEGVIQLWGQVRGGHEVEVMGVFPGSRRVLIANSWGPDWGKRGYCLMDWDTLERVLSEQGDYVCPVPTVSA